MLVSLGVVNVTLPWGTADSVLFRMEYGALLEDTARELFLGVVRDDLGRVFRRVLAR
jgi:hypothetical protein